LEILGLNIIQSLILAIGLCSNLYYCTSSTSHFRHRTSLLIMLSWLTKSLAC